MAPQSSIFPIFLRAEYREDANGIPQFISRIQQAAKISEAELKRVGTALNSALSAPRTGAGALDLGTGQLREHIRAQELAAAAAREIQAATLAAANATGTFNAALTPTINAYRDFAKAKEADVAASRAQLVALQSIETELEKGTRAVQARLQAEQNLANFRKTANINEGALRAAAGQASVDRAALSGATLEGVLGRTRTSNPAVDQQRAQQAKAAQEAARAQDELAASAARLTAQFLPLVAAQQRLDAVMDEANRLYDAGAISLQRYAQVTDAAEDQFREVENRLNGVTAAQERKAQLDREAEAAQRGLAASAAQLRAELDPMFAAQQRFDQELARADALLEAGTISTREYAAAQQLARDNLRQAAQAATATAETTERVRKAGTTAAQSVINSQRASRTAFIQLGQQMQDVAVQAQLGTSAFLIFGQQVPQAAFALSGLADSANKTQAAVGRVATFLSGPWGAAIFIAIAALGPLVQKFFEAGDEADKARAKTFNFADGLDVLKLSAQDATAAMDQLAGSLRSAISLQGNFLRGEIAIARQSAITLQAQIKSDQAELSKLRQQRTGFGANVLPSLFGPSGTDLRREQELQRRLEANRASLGPALEAAALASVAEANRNIAEASDPLLRQINEIDDAIARLNRRREQTVIRDDPLADNNLSQADFQRQLSDLARRRAVIEESQRESRKTPRKGTEAAERRRKAAEAKRQIREQEQLAKFAEQAAEQVARINERFDEQPRLIDQAAQATRQLDDVIAELEKRKPLGFEQLVQEAEDAKGTIEDALLRPFELIRQESEQRLAIETLIAQGRTDEAVALQEIYRLEQQNGEISEDRKRDIEAIVIAEQERLRVLRDQQAVFNAQLDVVQTVRRDLTDILSGRSTDFFGNFQQALQDLQGQRLFESLFGDTFRQIEEELQGKSPQGRANAAYVAEVNKTVSTTARLETAVSDLADTITAANDNIAGTGIAATSAGGFNPQLALVQSVLESAGLSGLSGITVSGNRPRETEIARVSISDLATRISRGISESIGVELEEVFGPRFAAMFGDIVGGAIAGQVTGGTTGAVLGGLQGLTASIPGFGGISEGLGALGQGAGIGTQLNGIIKAIGLPNSSTGSQIGGALGTPFGQPGQVIGSIAGSIIGGLLKGTPRGSATIGGVGGGLGITGTVGNRGSLKDTANDLAGSVVDAVNRIAEQLGASVNAGAGRVSIGQRKDSLRVDPSGRGATKIGNGAIDFGDDTEAAIAFAVRDLIQDGVITGLRQSEERLLKAGNDIEAALEDVLTFRSVFDRLEEIRDPLGGAIRRLNTEFEGLIELFERAGASTEEFADLEELYNLERARAIEEATDRVVGSLKQLLNDLTIGDSGLSLRSRRASAVSQFDALAARVAAGDTTAFDDFADISQQLLDIERQLFGSTQSYFDRLAQVTDLTEQAIADQTNVTGIGAGAPSPFDDSTAIARSIEAANSEQVGWLRAINDNLIALNPGVRPVVSVGGGSGGGFFPSLIQNF